MRRWAAVQIKACHSCPLSLTEWQSLDFPVLWNDIVRRPYEGSSPREQDEQLINRWAVVSNVLESGSLSEEVVRCGILDLDEAVEAKKKKSKERRSLIVDLSGLLTKTGEGAFLTVLKTDVQCAHPIDSAFSLPDITQRPHSSHKDSPI